MNFKMMILYLSIMSMCWWRKNIITMLLSLELLLISIYFMLSSTLLPASLSSLMIMLVMMVSGSSMGLALLVSLSRSHNSSSTNYMNMLTFAKNFNPLLTNSTLY